MEVSLKRGTSGVAYRAVVSAAHQSSTQFAAGTAEANLGDRPRSGFLGKI